MRLLGTGERAALLDEVSASVRRGSRARGGQNQCSCCDTCHYRKGRVTETGSDISEMERSGSMSTKF